MNLATPQELAQAEENERRAREAWQSTASSYKALFTVGRGREGDPELAPAAETVMRDLEAFCYANSRAAARMSSTGAIDPYQSLMNEGRREVFLRIQEMVGMTSETVRALARRNRTL